MSDSDSNTAISTVETTAVTKKKRKPINYAITRVLKANKFSPLNHLVRDVLPRLKPKDQAKVCIELLRYLYAPIASTTLSPVKRQKSGAPVQIGVQVNAQAKADEPVVTTTYSIQDLLAAAEDGKKK